jgi:hypothetical protein
VLRFCVFVFCVLYLICAVVCCGWVCTLVIVPVATACHRCLAHARNDRARIGPVEHQMKLCERENGGCSMRTNTKACRGTNTTDPNK